MRVVHFASSRGTALAAPLCGHWGSMESDWVAVAGGVTCADCLAVLAGPAEAAGTPPQSTSPGVASSG